jgi:hypothetical protein
MHPSYSTLTPRTVHAQARQVLQDALGFQPHGRVVTTNALLDLILLVAATTRTLFAVAKRFAFSHQSARVALRENLPSHEVLTTRLADALHAVAQFSRRDRRRRWTLAIDTHDVPYYGSRSTPHIVGGQKKRGTHHFFRYATAVLIHRRRRYTVGLIPVLTKTQPHQLVQTLLDQVAQRGLVVGGVVLDAEFDSGQTIAWLQGRNLNYTVPLRRKGNRSNRRNDWFSQPSGTLGTAEWVTEQTRLRVSTRVLVWQRPEEQQARVYAFGGWGSHQAVSESRRAWLGRQRYRQRFGIETSYRQKNQGRGWTSSRSVEYRLLLEGVAWVLRQMWVALTRRIALTRRLTPTAWVSELPLREMLDWLAEHLQCLYPHNRRIELTTHAPANCHSP